MRKITRKLLRRSFYWASFPILPFLIRVKWKKDIDKIPLTRDHYKLYSTIHKLFFRELSRFPNIVECKNYNDKIQWLKLFDQDEAKVICSDKIAVREYVLLKSKLISLPSIFQICKSFSEINFAALPNSFVIKTNHYSGNVVVVKEREKLDFNRAKNKINPSIGRIYGTDTGEWAYSHVLPRVFVEEYLGTPGDCPPPDYKFHCVDGKVRWLQYIYDRGKETKEVIVMPDGQISNIHFSRNMKHSSMFVAPKQWDTLLESAEQLAKGFKYVRVDLYLINDIIYFGELTFYPYMGCYTGDGQVVLGKLLTFSRASTKPLYILPQT